MQVVLLVTSQTDPRELDTHDWSNNVNSDYKSKIIRSTERRGNGKSMAQAISRLLNDSWEKQDSITLPNGSILYEFHKHED